MSITLADVAAIIAVCHVQAENPEICPKEQFPVVDSICKDAIQAYNELPTKGAVGIQRWQWMTTQIQDAYISIQYKLQINPVNLKAQIRMNCKNAQETHERLHPNSKPTR